MTDIMIEGLTYTLRAGAPMPVGGSTFVLQTFGGEEAKIENYLYTNDLPGSEEFRGQDGEYVSASFNRLQDITADSYTGKITYNATFVSER